jgi:hypothetical protein
MPADIKAFQLETEIVMKSIVSGFGVVLVPVPALAAVKAYPAPAIDLGVPAIAALIVVGVIALLLKRIKV